MYRKLCCIFAAVAMLFCLAMGVQAAEASFAAGASYYQLQNDEDGITIDHDMLLDLNGHHVTNASVAEGVTLRLMDSANDGYDASKCGSFSGTIDGTVEQLVKTTADEVGEVKSYLVINQDGVYSAHRYYAGITKINLVPGSVALGYKAEYYADDVINEMVTGYGYGLWINDLNPVQRIQEGKIADHELTLRLKNILSDNEALSQIGASATINGNAVICFEVDGQEVTVTGADHSTTLKDTVEAINTAIGNDRTVYTEAQLTLVRNMCNTYASYMIGWEQEYIFTEDKFAPVENVSVTYGETLALGQVFTAVEGVTIGENVTVTVNGEEIIASENWADTALNLNAGEAVITITDNDLCWTATNTVAVAKADPSYTVPTGLTATYGQTLNDVALTDNWTWKDSSESVGDAGTNSFTAVYTPADTANYNTVEVQISVMVGKADPSYTVPTGLTATYGDTLADVALTDGWSWKDSSASVGDAGTNSFTAVYTPADTANYNTVEVTVSVAVAKADPSYTVPTGLTATYGQTLSDVALTDNWTWKDSSASVGDAGTNSFTAVYTPADTANYNTVEVELSVEVGKADPEYTVPTGLTATYGQTLADVELPSGFEWKDSSESVGNAGTNSFTAVYTPADTANYNTVEVMLSVTVTRDNEDKFAVALYKGEPAFLYRVGNSDAVKLGSLFKALEGAQIGNVTVTVAALDAASNVSGVYTANSADWTAATLKFTGTGPVQVTIVDDDYCNPLTITLEVVNGYNITDYSQLQNRSSVLLNDITMSSGGAFYLSGATLYGNGFTFDVTAGAISGQGYFTGNYLVGLSNANLDNIQIIGAVYTQYGATSAEDYNRATVTVAGNSTIANCYISNCAAPVRVFDGNVEIINTTLKGGNFANLDIRGGNIILDNVTTINQVKDNDKAGETVVCGLGIVVYYEGVPNTTTIQIKNGITQYNYFTNKQADAYIQDSKASALTDVMFKSTYSALQYTDSDGETWVNAGIIVMCEAVGDDSITDVDGYITMDAELLGTKGLVHTCQPTAETIAAEVPEYKTAGQYAISPAYSFDYTTKNYVAKTEGSNDYCYYADGAVSLSMDEGDSFDWDTSILTVTKNGQTLPYTVTMNGTDYSGKTITFNTAGNYTVTYTYIDSNNYGLDAGGVTSYSKTYTKTVKLIVAVVEPDAKNAEFTFGSNAQVTERITVGNDTYISAAGVTADNTNWGCITVDGSSVYYPITEAEIVSTNLVSQEVQAYFYVFKDVVTIKDYQDGGVSDSYDEYTNGTKTMPSGLSLIKGSYGNFASGCFNKADSALTLGEANVFDYANGKGHSQTTRNNELCYASPSGLRASDRPEAFTIAKFSYTDSTNTTCYYYVGYHMKEASSLFESSGDSSCVAPETLVTLADGTQVRVDTLTGSEQLLVWNMETGMLDSAPIMFVDNDPTSEYEIVHLYFSDGTDVKVIYEHGFWDYDLNRYVYLDKDAANYIGHTFAKQSGDSLEKVQLTNVVIENEITTAWSPVTAGHLCYFVNGMLSMPGGVGGLFNIFDVDAETMTYDWDAMARDIETYGLFTYEELNAIQPLPYEMFEAAGGAYLKISIGKGNMTMEELIAMIQRYTKYF